MRGERSYTERERIWRGRKGKLYGYGKKVKEWVKGKVTKG